MFSLKEGGGKIKGKGMWRVEHRVASGNEDRTSMGQQKEIIVGQMVLKKMKETAVILINLYHISLCSLITESVYIFLSF